MGPNINPIHDVYAFPSSNFPLSHLLLYSSRFRDPQNAVVSTEQEYAAAGVFLSLFDPTFLRAGSMILLQFSRVLVWESEKLKSVYDFLLFDSRVRVGE